MTCSARSPPSSRPASGNIAATNSRYFVADVGEPLFAVVRLVGQPEAALLEEHDVGLGVARVVVDEELQEARQAQALEAADGGDELGHGLDRRDLGEQRLDRRGAELLESRFVGEAGEEVADLARLGAGRGLLRALDDVADGLLGVFGQHVKEP